MTTDIDKILNQFELKVLDIRKAGCVVFHFDESIEQEKLAFYGERLKQWAQSIGINLLILPKSLDISVIPREVITQSSIHTRVETIEKQLTQLLTCFKPPVEVETVENVEVVAPQESLEQVLDGISPNVNIHRIDVEEQ